MSSLLAFFKRLLPLAESNIPSGNVVPDADGYARLTTGNVVYCSRSLS